MARGVLPTGEPGPWSSPHKVRTPKAPSLIVLGDSISSGHHNDYGDKHKTTCDDPNYGYAYAFSRKWLGELPGQWTGGGYHNLAHSGFATQKRNGSGISGSVLEGGVNACDEQAGKLSPVARATELLSPSTDSWNRIVISAGINDTNWGEVVEGIIQIQVAEDFARAFLPIFQQLRGLGPDLMNEHACAGQIDSR